MRGRSGGGAGGGGMRAPMATVIAEIAKAKGMTLEQMDMMPWEELEREIAAHQALGEITRHLNQQALEKK